MTREQAWRLMMTLGGAFGQNVARGREEGEKKREAQKAEQTQQAEQALKDQGAEAETLLGYALSPYYKEGQDIRYSREWSEQIALLRAAAQDDPVGTRVAYEAATGKKVPDQFVGLGGGLIIPPTERQMVEAFALGPMGAAQAPGAGRMTPGRALGQATAWPGPKAAQALAPGSAAGQGPGMDLLTREQRDKLPSSLALMVAGGVSGKVGGVTTQLPSASERVERAERLLGQQQTRAHEAKMYPLQERTAQVGLAAARLGLKGQRKTVREADEIDSLIGLVSAGQATPLTIPRLRQLDKDTADVAQKWTDLKQAEDDEHAIAAYSVTASKEQLDEPSIFDWTRRMIRQGYSQQDIQENQALGRAAPEDKGNYFPPDMKATTFKMAQLSAQRAEIEHGWQEERVIREGQRFAAEMRRGAINDHKSAMAHFDARVAAAQQSGRAMTPWEIAALEQIANMTFEALPVYAGPEQKAVGAAPGTTSFRVGEVPKERSRARGGGGGGGGTAKPGKKDRGTYLGGYTVMLHGPYKLSGQTFRVSYGWANEESILISTPTGNMTVPKGYYEVMTGAQTSAAKTTAAIRAQQAGYGAGGGGGGKYTIEDAVNDLGGPK